MRRDLGAWAQCVGGALDVADYVNAIEGAGFVLFDSVKTDDPTALIGLPMIWVADRLLQLGYLLP